MKTLLTLGLLLLSPAIASAQGHDYIDNGQTQTWLRGVLSHACPPGYAMGGINFGGDGNTFKCSFVGQIVEETVYTVERGGMLACAPGYFMTALNVERNFARCSRTWNHSTNTFLTGGPNTAYVTECAGSNGYQAAVMVGFHKERRAMLCESVRR
jgi:hypothetical protein